MNANDRRKKLLNVLTQREELSLVEAMREFSVSAATARRDFAYLDRRGLVSRGRSFIRRIEVGAGTETPLGIRETQFEREKDAIMREASRLLRPNDVVFVDTGSTLLRLADYLPAFNLRVVTGFLQMAVLLAEKQARLPNLEICLVGGTLYPQSYYTYGPTSVKHIDVFHAGLAIISPDSLNECSFQEVNEFVAENQRAMIRNSDRVILAASHNKFNKKSMIRVADMDEHFVVITDFWEANEPVLRKIENRGVKVIRAKVF